MEGNRQSWSDFWRKEDWWAVWFGLLVFLGILAGIVRDVPKVQGWSTNPLTAFPVESILPLLALGLGLGALTAVGTLLMKENWKRYLGGFFVVYALAVLAYLGAAPGSILAPGTYHTLFGVGDLAPKKQIERTTPTERHEAPEARTSCR